MSLAVVHFDEFLPDATCGVDQLMQALELQRVLLFVIRVLAGLQETHR